LKFVSKQDNKPILFTKPQFSKPDFSFPKLGLGKEEGFETTSPARFQRGKPPPWQGGGFGVVLH